ncbi:MAG: hypothetical protein R3C49_09330 [Planctomycetaceae bacterium]
MKRLSSVILTLSIPVTLIILTLSSLTLGVISSGSDGQPVTEWVWNRHQPVSDAAGFADRFLPCSAAGLAFALTAFGGLRRIQRRSWRSHHLFAGIMDACLLALLIVVSWFWLSAVQKAAPMEHRLAKPMWVLYDPSSSGYFFEAAFRIPDVSEFLKGYEQRMREGDVLHVGTHPPGLFLLSSGCLTACEQLPELQSAVRSLQDRDVIHSFRFLENEAKFERPLNGGELAALSLLSELSGIAVVLAIAPIWWLSRMLFDAATAWKTACLWVTLPCLAVFCPKSDVLFPLTSTSVLALAVAALITDVWWKRFPAAVLAGLVLWLGLLLSLAHLTVIVAIAAFVGLRMITSRAATFRRDTAVMLLMATTVAVSCLVFEQLTDCRLPTVWRLNLSNHAGFYDQFQRTWWRWFLLNPLELAFAVGLPLTSIVVPAIVRTVVLWLRELRSATGVNDGLRARRSTSALLTVATLLTWMALWLSGKNCGEAARLWCFLTPWLLLSAGHVLQSRVASPDDHRLGEKSFWRLLVVTQLIAGAITVGSVSGFSF